MDDDVERVAQAIFAIDESALEAAKNAVPFAWNGFYDEHFRAAIAAYLFALPNRELLREALSALDSVTHCRNPDKCKSCSNIARAAADKIRAALEHQQKGEGL